MATRGVLYVVFLLPVLFSAIFGTAVMADILQEPGRELNMLRFTESGSDGQHDSPVEIVGLKAEYSASQPVSFDVRASDPAFSCGDLYITIYSDDSQIVTQRGFFNQCYEQNNPILPTDDEFSETVDIPGKYRIVIELTDKAQIETATTSGEFTVE